MNKIYIIKHDYTFDVNISGYNEHLTININNYMDEANSKFVDALTCGFHHLQDTDVTLLQLEKLLITLSEKFLYEMNDSITREHIKYQSNSLCLMLKQELLVAREQYQYENRYYKFGVI